MALWHRVSVTVLAAALACGCGSSSSGTGGSGGATGSAGGSTGSSSSAGSGGAGTGGGGGAGGQGTGGSAPLWCDAHGAGHQFCDDFSGSDLTKPWTGFFSTGTPMETSNTVDFTSPPASDAFAITGGSDMIFHITHRYGAVPTSTVAAFDLRSTLAFSAADGGQLTLLQLYYQEDFRVSLRLGKDGLAIDHDLAGTTVTYPVKGTITPGAWTRVTLTVVLSSGGAGSLGVTLDDQSGLAVSGIQTTGYVVGASTQNSLELMLGYKAAGPLPTGEIDYDDVLWDVTP
jgi:hypothetical protein